MNESIYETILWEPWPICTNILTVLRLATMLNAEFRGKGSQIYTFVSVHSNLSKGRIHNCHSSNDQHSSNSQNKNSANVCFFLLLEYLTLLERFDPQLSVYLLASWGFQILLLFFAKTNGIKFLNLCALLESRPTCCKVGYKCKIIVSICSNCLSWW